MGFKRRFVKAQHTVSFDSKLGTTSEELLHLDAVRFLASAGIVALHSMEFFVLPSERRSLFERTDGLGLFVDLFFVISGFVIAYVYHGRTTSVYGYGRFMQRRIGRLIPLHWLTLTVSICVFWAATQFGIYGKLTPTFSAACVANTALLLHPFLSCGNGIYFNEVSWSIAVEMVLYLSFPVVDWVGSKKNGAVLAVVTVIALVIAASVDILTNEDRSQSWGGLPPLLRAFPSFLLGGALYYNRSVVSRLPRPRMLLIISLVACVVAMCLDVPRLTTLGVVYIVALAAIASDLSKIRSGLVAKIAPLGQLTYSIYMWHLLIVLVLMNAFGDKWLHVGPVGMAAVATICYALIIAVAYVSYFAFETPARKWIDGLMFLPRTPPVSALSLDVDQNRHI